MRRSIRPKQATQRSIGPIRLRLRQRSRRTVELPSFGAPGRGGLAFWGGGFGAQEFLDLAPVELHEAAPAGGVEPQVEDGRGEVPAERDDGADACRINENFNLVPLDTKGQRV